MTSKYRWFSTFSGSYWNSTLMKQIPLTAPNYRRAGQSLSRSTRNPSCKITQVDQTQVSLRLQRSKDSKAQGLKILRKVPTLTIITSSTGEMTLILKLNLNQLWDISLQSSGPWLCRDFMKRTQLWSSIRSSAKELLATGRRATSSTWDFTSLFSTTKLPARWSASTSSKTSQELRLPWLKPFRSLAVEFLTEEAPPWSPKKEMKIRDSLTLATPNTKCFKTWKAFRRLQVISTSRWAKAWETPLDLKTNSPTRMSNQTVKILLWRRHPSKKKQARHL